MSTNNNHDDDIDRVDVEHDGVAEHDDDAIESVSYSIIYDDDAQSDDGEDAAAAAESPETGESDTSAASSESEESADAQSTDAESSNAESNNAAEAGNADASADADDAESSAAEDSSGNDRNDSDDDSENGDIAAANAARVNATLKLAKTAAAASASAAGNAGDADAGVAEPSLRLSARLDKELGGGREDEILLRSYPTFALNKVTLTDRKTGRNVLDRVDAACYAGHVYAMLVSSDEERIALMSVMTGLKVPSDGNVMVKSANIFELEPLELRGHRLGVIPQRYAVRADLSAERNVLYAMDASGRTFLKPKPVIARELLEQVGFASDTPNARVGSLSALEQRKVAVARAIACEADVIIADEPTGGLSVDDSVDLLRVLRSLTHGEHKRAVVIVTSDREVADTAYRTFVIGD